MRGATDVGVARGGVDLISIHAPHAGRDRGDLICQRVRQISIHAPHAGRDIFVLPIGHVVSSFQSTRPMRGATIFSSTINQPKKISIHAPHAGRDRFSK